MSDAEREMNEKFHGKIKKARAAEWGVQMREDYQDALLHL